MPVDPSPGALPKKRPRRAAKTDLTLGISPGLREHITAAAQKIRKAHKAELADVLKANRAGRLFRDLIRPNGTPGDALQEVGGLLTDAIRTGTGLLEGSLTFLAREWVTTMLARPTEMPPAEEPAPAAAAASQAPEAPAASPEEITAQKILRRFMPMLAATVKQGGNGYGLAETVIRLFGRATYDQAAGLGSDRIMQLVKAEPDLWAQAAPIESDFRRFLDEFTGYDRWAEEQSHRPRGN